MTRRAFVAALTAGAASSAWPALGQVRDRTPGQILGPFFPVARPGETDVDLTRVSGRTTRAEGQLVRVVGRVLTEGGRPVPDAGITVWQADASGRYRHPSDKSPRPVDPSFQGYAVLTSDRNARFEFLTIKPGPYRDDGAGGVRAPHIHFEVTGRSNRLITQMYFEGEDLNDTDRVLAFAGGGRDRLMAKLSSDASPDALRTATWDIVLRDG
jgi:protocatechuate 3,4-dioxygenase, beta subunit